VVRGIIQTFCHQEVQGAVPERLELGIRGRKLVAVYLVADCWVVEIYIPLSQCSENSGCVLYSSRWKCAFMLHFENIFLYSNFTVFDLNV